jgi:GDPmannose 4,6-dehydratase
MKSIIFGARGQDGYYLSKLLQKLNVEVIGISHSKGELIGNVSDSAFVESIIKKYKPNYIFHFAANSTTSHDALFDNHGAISTGTINILESVRLYSPTSKVFLSGSAMQFKNEGIPIDEQTPFEASSPYSFARIHSVYIGRYYRNTFGLQVYVGYLFNHDSPLRTERHVNMKIIKAVKEIVNGNQEKLEIGNIDVKKEFNYAGDIVEAVWTLVNQDTVSEAIIGSGKVNSIKDWLKICFKIANMNWQDHVIVSEKFIPQYQTLICNPKLIMSLGWKPQVNITQLANKMFEQNDNNM